MVFMFVWLVVLALLAYTFIDSCRRRFRPTGNTRRVNPPSYPGGGGSSGRGGRGSFPFTPSSPPPPYSKDPPASGDGAWRPGFWSGAALGAFANHLWNRNSGGGQSLQSPLRAYDWETERTGPFQTRRRTMPGFSSYEDRGEGPSNLGAMRTSSGYGGSRSR